jgi:hypothetical protein
MDTPIANSDPIVAGLLPEGVTLNHIIALFLDANPVIGKQLLRRRLGATHPANLSPSELAEFIKYVLAAAKSAGIRDPTAKLAAAAKLGSSAATTEDPFAGRENDGRVFRERRERNFFVGLSPREKKEWLRDHPDRWQTREEFLRDLHARARTDVAAEPTEPPSTPSATEVPTGGESNGLLPVPGEDKPQPHKSATNTAPPTIANPEATVPTTATAGDEINIGGRRFVSEPRVAKMLCCSLRTLQRSRTKGKGPASKKIGRKVFYELNDLQEWIDRGKIR